MSREYDRRVADLKSTAARLREDVVSMFESLASPAWCPDDGPDPYDLETAVDNYLRFTGRGESRTCQDACELAGVLFAEDYTGPQEIEDIDEIVCAVVCRIDEQEAWSQDDDDDEDEDEDRRNALEEDAHEQDRDARNDEPCAVVCLDSFRDARVVVEL